MEKRVTISLRVPGDLLARLRQVAAEEERPLNTQVLRFIRTGLEQYEARGTLAVAFDAYCQRQGSRWPELAEFLGVTLEGLQELALQPLPNVTYKQIPGSPQNVQPVGLWGPMEDLAQRTGANLDNLMNVVRTVLPPSPNLDR